MSMFELVCAAWHIYIYILKQSSSSQKHLAGFGMFTTLPVLYLHRVCACVQLTVFNYKIVQCYKNTVKCLSADCLNLRHDFMLSSL